MSHDNQWQKELKPPPRILLVDDSEPDIKITLRAFQMAQAQQVLKNEIYVARNGEEALNFLHNEGAYADKTKAPRPHIILLDINMPKMNGHECLVAIKSDPHLRTIPVIMLTSSQHELDVRKSYENGAACYIQKPVGFENFQVLTEKLSLFWQLASYVEI